MFQNFYKNKKIFITGDTGFKGSWLAIWLNHLGAEICGYALPPINKYDNFVITHIGNKIKHVDGDIRDIEKLKQVILKFEPEIIFHLAAQPLVLESYKNPRYTFETNIMGIVNVFEASRSSGSVKTIINITSDKCYKNNEWIWGYRENEPMGGDDPYSCSKGCSELITNSYIKSFFKNENIKVCSARAGNVIGAGDWAENRIIPDFFKAYLNNDKLKIRNPYSTRPWQHVLEPLSGYLWLATELNIEDIPNDGYNFGPKDYTVYSVLDLIKEIQKFMKEVNCEFEENSNKQHEAHLLKLDITKSHKYLNWSSVLNFNETVEFTVNGYLDDLNNKNSLQSRIAQINNFNEKAKKQNISWAI